MDIDGDGNRDILSGSYSRMEQAMAGLFQVLLGREGGGFKAAVPLAGTDGEPLIIPVKDDSEITKNICTRPTAVDWDGDGDLDLVVGNFAGSFFLFTGEGDGRFVPRPEPILADGSPLSIPDAHSDPFPVDWDGDGDLDVVSGSANGGVYWAENRAGAGLPPELKPFVTLIEPGQRIADGQILREEDIARPGRATRVWVDDINNDGKLDVIVGDSVTLISPAEGISEEDFAKRQADWQQSFQEALAKFTSATDEDEQAEASQRYRDVYQQRDEFMHSEMTGFVWLYLGK